VVTVTSAHIVNSLAYVNDLHFVLMFNFVDCTALCCSCQSCSNRLAPTRLTEQILCACKWYFVLSPSRCYSHCLCLFFLCVNVHDILSTRIGSTSCVSHFGSCVTSRVSSRHASPHNRAPCFISARFAYLCVRI
jgi:hypothetical protein